MSFASPAFLFILLPLVLLGFFSATRWQPRLSVPFLLLVSLAYCGQAGFTALACLLTTASLNFILVGRILNEPAGSARQRLWLVLGLAASLAPLVWYKWIAAVAFSSSETSGAASIMIGAIPLGLAFYALQQVTALFDIQRPGAVRLPYLRHLLWSGLFLQLPAGPIFPYRDAAPQYRRLGQRGPALGMLAQGISLIILGLCKKTALADPIGAAVDASFAMAQAGPVPMIDAWYGFWGFMLQLYFDFSAYSDIAIGAALCLGLKLPANFNSPLRARSPGEYINRWHMSLMAFVREYIFSPIFRRLHKARFNRGKWRSIVAWIIATLLAYFVVAAWHAPTIEIMFYGGLAGIGVVATQIPSLLPRSRHIAAMPATLKQICSLLGRALLVFGMTLFATIFRADSHAALINLLAGLRDSSSLSLNPVLKPYIPQALQAHITWDGFLLASDSAGLWPLLALFAGTIIVFCLPNSMQLFHIIPAAARAKTKPLQWRPDWRWGIALGLMLSAWVMLVANGSIGRGFVYERF